MTTSELKDDNFWGVISYEIAGDGCLNGLWTNNDRSKNGIIMNEIARKEAGDRVDIPGNYQSSWIEPDRRPINANLKISENGISFNFEWFVDGEIVAPLFKGVGMRVGLYQIVCFYWKGDEDFNVETIFSGNPNP